MDVERDKTENTERIQLVGFGHVNCMPYERWPKKVLKWTPLEREKGEVGGNQNEVVGNKYKT